MILILFAVSALAMWGILKAISKAASRSAEKIRMESRKAQEEARAEQARLRLEWQQRQAEARLETQRLISVEREQMRQAREQAKLATEQAKLANEQAKQAEILRKHDEQIAKLEEQMYRAQLDIDQLTIKIDELGAYGKFLMEQRDKCTKGSAEYWKWQNKLSVVDDKVYRLNAQRSKASFARRQAEQRLSA